jgi:hypothetical protein
VINALPQGKRLGAHSIKGWVGPRARLDAGIRSPDRPTVESRNTDCAVPAHMFFIQEFLNKVFRKLSNSIRRKRVNNFDKGCLVISNSEV